MATVEQNFNSFWTESEAKNLRKQSWTTNAPLPIHSFPKPTVEPKYPEKMQHAHGAPVPVLCSSMLTPLQEPTEHAAQIPEPGQLVYHCEYQIDSPFLQFESRFEGGNLHAAYQVTSSEYVLYVRPDTNTTGHIQWFYFQVIPDRPRSVVFHLVNITKPHSLYGKGMRPVVFTDHWEHGGEEILYTPNQPFMVPKSRPASATSMRSARSSTSTRIPKNRKKQSYTLSFRYDFHTEGPVYFAHSFPYTYSQLQSFLLGLDHPHCRHKVIGKSFLGNKYHLLISMDLVTITEHARTPEELKHRPCVMIFGRIHPGEPNSSYLCQYLMEYAILTQIFEF
jgi:hypothetical protein